MNFNTFQYIPHQSCSNSYLLQGKKTPSQGVLLVCQHGFPSETVNNRASLNTAVIQLLIIRGLLVVTNTKLRSLMMQESFLFFSVSVKLMKGILCTMRTVCDILWKHRRWDLMLLMFSKLGVASVLISVHLENTWAHLFSLVLHTTTKHLLNKTQIWSYWCCIIWGIFLDFLSFFFF